MRQTIALALTILLLTGGCATSELANFASVSDSALPSSLPQSEPLPLAPSETQTAEPSSSSSQAHDEPFKRESPAPHNCAMAETVTYLPPPGAKIVTDSDTIKMISDEIYLLEQSGLLWISWDTPNDIPVNFLIEYFNFCNLYSSKNPFFDKYHSSIYAEWNPDFKGPESLGYSHMPAEEVFHFLKANFFDLETMRLESADRFEDGFFNFQFPGYNTTPSAIPNKKTIYLFENQYIVLFRDVGYKPNTFDVQVTFMKEGEDCVASSNHAIRKNPEAMIQPVPLRLPIKSGTEAVCLVRDYLNLYDFFPVGAGLTIDLDFHKDDVFLGQTDELFDSKKRDEVYTDCAKRTGYVVSLGQSSWLGMYDKRHSDDVYIYDIYTLIGGDTFEEYEVQIETGEITKIK